MADRKVTIPGQNVPIQIGTSINPDWYMVLKFLETLQPLSDVDFAAIDAAIALKSNILRSINDQTGTTYDFAVADSGKYVRLTNSSPITATIQPFSTIAIPSRAQIDLIQGGAGKLTIAAGSGVTINSLAGYKSLAGRYAGGTLVHTDTLNTWDLVGNLIA